MAVEVFGAVRPRRTNKALRRCMEGIAELAKLFRASFVTGICQL
jgi:hypothetical protein